MTIVRSESSSHLGELHRVKRLQRDLCQRCGVGRGYWYTHTTLSHRASGEQMCCYQVHHFVDVTDLAPLARRLLLGLVPHLVRTCDLSACLRLGIEQCRAGGASGPACLPRLPQLNVTHEGKCWGSGQWRSGLMGEPSPQTHSARYCFFGGRTHPCTNPAVARFLMRCALLPATLFSLSSFVRPPPLQRTLPSAQVSSPPPV